MRSPLQERLPEGDGEEASAALEAELHRLVDEIVQGQESPVEAQISS